MSTHKPHTDSDGTLPRSSDCIFFFNDTATTEIYTLSLHDALPISAGSTGSRGSAAEARPGWAPRVDSPAGCARPAWPRSEEHTSELQSQSNLVCRLLLEKKKKTCPGRCMQLPRHTGGVVR